jgi:hypothetical protein
VLARWVRQCVVGIKHRRALSRLADLDDHRTNARRSTPGQLRAHLAGPDERARAVR